MKLKESKHITTAAESTPPPSETKEVPVIDKELEKIVTDALAETIKDEKIEQIIPMLEKIEKEDKMPLNDENTIHKEIITNRSKINTMHDSINKFRMVEHNHYVEMMKELHYLKKHYLKVTTTLIFIACFGSYVAGTQHSTIAPYIGKVYDVFTNFKSKGE